MVEKVWANEIIFTAVSVLMDRELIVFSLNHKTMIPFKSVYSVEMEKRTCSPLMVALYESLISPLLLMDMYIDSTPYDQNEFDSLGAFREIRNKHLKLNE